MAKNLKLNIKNEQLAGALNLSNLKNKLASKKGEKAKQEEAASKEEPSSLEASDDKKEGAVAAPKVKARSKSVFADPQASEALKKSRLPEQEKEHEDSSSQISLSQAKKDEFSFREEESSPFHSDKPSPFSQKEPEQQTEGFSLSKAKKGLSEETISSKNDTVYFEIPKPEELQAFLPPKEEKKKPAPVSESNLEKTPSPSAEENTSSATSEASQPGAPRLGPTGKHINDLIPKKPAAPSYQEKRPYPPRDSQPYQREPYSRDREGNGRESSAREVDGNRASPQRDFQRTPRPNQGPYAPRDGNREGNAPQRPNQGPYASREGTPPQRDSRDGLYVPKDPRDGNRAAPSSFRDAPRNFTPRTGSQGPYTPRPEGERRTDGTRPDGTRSEGYKGQNPYPPRERRDGPYTPRPPGARPPYDPNNRPPYDPNRAPYDPNRRPYTPGRPPMSAQNMPLPPKPSVLEGDVKIRERKESVGGDALKKGSKFKDFKDVKPIKKNLGSGKTGSPANLLNEEGEAIFRKRKKKNVRYEETQETIRPTTLSVQLPISIKDLAQEMKLKASQLISKLFLQGLIVTLNDVLDDETTIQLLGHEFGCDITIDVKEAERIKITGKTIQEEVKECDPSLLITRPPVIAFMGHVDHGKTSLIDAIRSSNRTAGEAGAITQHIGAFKYKTSHGEIAILDTPGHEAFSAMRTRGAQVTDIVVLVVAGDEGIKPQTVEAIQQAKEAKVTIVVAINKCDKPGFNVETVYRQLSEQELLPEAWGGNILTVNCSAVTKEGIDTLLENLALQSEILELKANPEARARGTVIESEMHKGMGVVATVLVQNGSLKKGDSIVLGGNFGKIKTMRNEHNQELSIATPSTPVCITGLSGLPEAGDEFIVVKNEKEAKEIAEARRQGMKQTAIQQTKKVCLDNLMEKAQESPKKVLNIILRADVQGSLEAMKTALQKIKSTKAELSIIFSGVGEVSESDVQLASASKAIILGFHAAVESHAEGLLKQQGVILKQHNIIYHAVDDVKELMKGLLDKIAIETEKGKAIVKTTFKSSQHGIIAGCQVTEGVIQRSNHLRVIRDGVVVYKGHIHSLKRVKEDVREVAKGLECGVLLQNSNDIKENDLLEAFEITYITQEL